MIAAARFFRLVADTIDSAFASVAARVDAAKLRLQLSEAERQLRDLQAKHAILEGRVAVADRVIAPVSIGLQAIICGVDEPQEVASKLLAVVAEAEGTYRRSESEVRN